MNLLSIIILILIAALLLAGLFSFFHMLILLLPAMIILIIVFWIAGKIYNKKHKNDQKENNFSSWKTGNDFFSWNKKQTHESKSTGRKKARDVTTKDVDD